MSHASEMKKLMEVVSPSKKTLKEGADKYALPCPKCGNPVDGDSTVGPKGAMMHKACAEKKSVSEAADKKCPKCKKTGKACTCKKKKKTVKEDAMPVDRHEIAGNLSEIRDNMLDEIRQAYRLLRGTPEQSAASAYWVGHIKSALGDENYKTHATTMADTIRYLEDDGNDQDGDDNYEGPGLHEAKIPSGASSKKCMGCRKNFVGTTAKCPACKKKAKKIDESIDPALIADGVVGAAVAFILKKVSDPAKAVDVADMILEKLKSKMSNGR